MSLKINFTKMVASGNDFVVIEEKKARIKNSKLSDFAKEVCDRKFGIGADGVLVLGRSDKAQAMMRIFNSDGSEAEMCGNGSRCAALYYVSRMLKPDAQIKDNITMETKAGIIQATVIAQDDVRINLTDPKDMRLDVAVKLARRELKVNFINTGVPHAVIFVQDVDNMDVSKIGSQIRYHKEFAPRGTNVDFVQIIDDDSIKIRTYERGVEDETLACGTGSTASAIISAAKMNPSNSNAKINVHTRSGEVLRVYFKKLAKEYRDVWLEGKARIVYGGTYQALAEYR